MTATPEVQLTVCPKCKEMSLHTIAGRGEDDHGQIEGEQSYCEKCGYMDEWMGRC